MLETKFTPRKFLEGKHLQTIYNVLFPPDNSLDQLSKTGAILLPSTDNSGDHLYLEHNFPLAESNGHYLILLHGMEGSSESHYMVSVAKAAIERGYGVIRANLRNCGKGFGLASKPYNAGQSEDLGAIVSYVTKKYSPRIFVGGFSLSANLVLKYMGESPPPSIIAFSATSPPMDLKRSCDFIDSRSGSFYRNHFLETLKEKVSSGLYPITEEQKLKILKCKTFFDFDDFFTAPMSGYLSVLHYYQKCSSLSFLDKIQTPGLIVHAEDDPVVPPESWGEVPWTSFPSLTTVITEKGGHVGFVSNPSSELPDGRWLPKILLDFFDSHVKRKK